MIPPVSPHLLLSNSAASATDSASRMPSAILAVLPTAVKTKILYLGAWHTRTRSSSQPRTLALRSRSESLGVETLVGDDDDSRPSSSRSSPPALASAATATTIITADDNERDINWRYADQGLTFLHTALAQPPSPSHQPDPSAQAFTRQLYVHALVYLLQALPSSLSRQEATCLRAALPPTLTVQVDGQQQLLPPPPYRRQAKKTPSVLHRVLASTIIQLFILSQFVLPHIKVLLRSAYEYDRTHHLSEKAFALGMKVAEQVGRKGVDVWGRVGSERLGEALVWWVEGVSGGVAEGVGEGVKVLCGGRAG